MQNALCVACRFKTYDNKVQSLMTLCNLLQSYRDKIPRERPPIQYIYNWGIPNSCNFKIPCMKVETNKRLFNQYREQAQDLLYAYLSQDTDETRYFKILDCLRGAFPQVYNQFNSNYRRKVREE